MKGRRFAPALDASPMVRIAVDAVASDLVGAHPNLLRFFATLFSGDGQRGSGKTLAYGFGLMPATMRSRFQRVGLPSPSHYRRVGQFVLAAYLLETPHASANRVGLAIGYNVPQPFHACARRTLGMSVQQMRETHTGASMLATFRAELIAPYRDTLLTFDPLAPVAFWHSRRSGYAAPLVPASLPISHEQTTQSIGRAS